MHPLLVPGSWLVEGNYYPTGRPPNRVKGVTEVRSSEQFPETLQVEGEIRDADDPASRPVRSTYHVDVVTAASVRFRMDSLPLATVLVGDGRYDASTLVLRYGSPDKRILGVETYVSTSPVEMRTSGVLLVDGAPATMWLARLERVHV